MTCFASSKYHCHQQIHIHTYANALKFYMILVDLENFISGAELNKSAVPFPSGQATFHSHLPGGQETSKSSACVWVILVEGDFVGLFFWS